MLNLDDKQYWGDSQYIKLWWSNIYAQYDELEDLEDIYFGRWVTNILKMHGILDSNSKWYMSRDIELEAAIGTDMVCEKYDLPPLKDDDIWGKLGLSKNSKIYSTSWDLGYGKHHVTYYQHKNMGVLELDINLYPNSGLTYYFVRTI
tara:strand:- start:285 stop:725 length:441 start_codon:yes stop_codon:yes gene_type:complete